MAQGKLAFERQQELAAGRRAALPPRGQARLEQKSESGQGHEEGHDPGEDSSTAELSLPQTVHYWTEYNHGDLLWN